MAVHSIFIGYRREDTADVSGRVYDRLCLAFGENAIFKDVYNLGPGVEFGEYILGVLTKCRVFLALIGPTWEDLRNETGKRRLDDPKDWVRIELETALATPSLQVIPVLVNGASMGESTSGTLAQIADVKRCLGAWRPRFPQGHG